VKRKADNVSSQRRGQLRAKRRLDKTVAGLTSQVSKATKEAGDLRRKIASLSEAHTAAEAEASALADALSMSEEQLAAQKLRSAELIKKNKILGSRCDELEYAVLELEDKIEEGQFQKAVSGMERARSAQADVDEDYDEEKPKGAPSRQHPFEVRVALSGFLALGINPSAVVPALKQVNFQFPGEVPRLDFVRKIRRELRVMVLALAAATAADPSVSFIFFCSYFKGQTLTNNYSFYSQELLPEP